MLFLFTRCAIAAMDAVAAGMANRNTIITGSLYLVGEMELLLDEKDKSKMVPVEMEEAGNATGPVIIVFLFAFNAASSASEGLFWT